MRRLVLLILAMATLLPSLAQAYDILVLLSRRDPAYEEALKGFRAERITSQRVVVLSDYAEVDVVRIVREDRPRLILAVGDTALTASRKVRQTPVVALMALGIHSLHGSQPNLTGIGMFASPESYINIFQGMRKRRVGVIHNPAKTGWYLRQARQAVGVAGIELVVRQVVAPRDTLARLASLTGKVDAIWMLPDTTAVTRETSEAYFHFAQEQGIPAISFAAAYLGLGAAAVIDIDRAGLGRQAGAMAAAILSGVAPADIPLEPPHSHTLKTNTVVLKRLGLALLEFVNVAFSVRD